MKLNSIAHYTILMRYHVDLDQAKDLFDRFEIIEHIDSGGQKDVFRAKYQGEDVVVKTLVVNSYQASKRAEREVEVMSETQSEILVDFIMSFPEKADDQELFVMVEEFIPGKTLYEYIANEGPSVEMGINVAEKLLTVLKEFYQNSWVHRDIKPRNIMITPDGDVRLLDVGIVRMLNQEGLTPTAQHRAPGTPGYSAPEQIRNEKEKQDTRTDIFSTGIVTFETMSGKHPFKSQGMAVDDAILNGERLSIVQAMMDDEYEEIEFYFDMCLHPTMNKRFRKPDHALSEIEELKSGYL